MLSFLTEPDMEGSPLGGLPAELRNTIFYAALVQEGPIPIRRRSDNRSTRTRHHRRHVPLAALLQTCQQIKSEATAMFYTLDTFLVAKECHDDTNRRLKAWLKALRPKSKKLLFRIRLGPVSGAPSWRLDRCHAYLRSKGVDLDGVELVLKGRRGEDVTG